MYERRKDAGRGYYGDLQGLENWSEREDVLDQFARMGIAANFEHTPFSAITVLNGEKSWRFRGPRPGFYLVRRGQMAGSLDQGLKEQALACGVKILFNTPLDRSDADIVATGPMNRHRFGIDKGVVFQTSLPDMACGLVNDRAAYKGYAYLLVAGGYGCMCTVLFDRFELLNDCFCETERIFRNWLDFDMENPRLVGGMGSFLLKNVFTDGGRLHVGEAAGLQDLLWGFGIRTAVTSGYLAAQSIITGSDYGAEAHRLLAGKQQASMVNRYLWEKLGRGNYAFIMDRIDKSGDHLDFFRSFYNLNLVHRLAYPFARISMNKRYNILP